MVVFNSSSPLFTTQSRSQGPKHLPLEAPRTGVSDDTQLEAPPSLRGRQDQAEAVIRELTTTSQAGCSPHSPVSTPASSPPIHTHLRTRAGSTVQPSPGELLACLQEEEEVSLVHVQQTNQQRPPRNRLEIRSQLRGRQQQAEESQAWR
jgi:hypothetical protein